MGGGRAIIYYNKLRPSKVANAWHNIPFHSDHPGIINEGDKSDDELTYYPWESLLCEDVDPEACGKFKPFCKIIEVVAYRKCRKTCGLCKKDNPKNKGT